MRNVFLVAMMMCFSLQIINAKSLVEGENFVIQTTPYLEHTQDGITLMWQTRIPTESWVEIGVKPDELSQKKKKTDKQSVKETQFHKIRLTDLIPGKTYYYRICSRELKPDRNTGSNEPGVIASDLFTFTFSTITSKDTVGLQN